MARSPDMVTLRQIVEAYNRAIAEGDKPYATMDDGPEDYLYRKDGKQKLVGSEYGDEESQVEYRYRSEIDREEDVDKIWHYGKAPGEDWMVIPRSPYDPMADEDFEKYVDFHQEHGRWPTQEESGQIEGLL